MQVFLALFGSLCSCVVGLLFIVEILRNKNIRPHPFTWSVWTLLGVIGFSVAFSEMPWNVSLLPLAVVTVSALTVFGISLTRRSNEEISIPKALPLLALGGVIGWVVFDDPLIAGVCVVLADFIAGIPTFIKTYKDPASEVSWWVWMLDSVGLGAALLSTDFTLAAALYPLYIVCAATTLSLISLLRSQSLSS